MKRFSKKLASIILAVTCITAVLCSCGKNKDDKVYDIWSLDKNTEYTAVGEQLFDFRSKYEKYGTIQGGYYNGENFYIAAIYKDAKDFETVRILVLDSKGNILKESGELPLDHANNITYNKKLDKLVVTHCQSPIGHYDRYSMVDPETLEITETDDLFVPFFAMAYSPEKDMYASGEWGGEALDTWYGDFTHAVHKEVEKPASLSQGVFADGEGIYFVRSSQNGAPAEIRVYDWDLNLVRTINLSLPDSVEPESINIVDGKIYVVGTNWGTGRGVAYLIHFEKS